MRKRMLALFVSFALSLAVVGAQAKEKASAKGGSDVSQMITNMENQWAKDSKAGNGEAIGMVLADNAIVIDSDGSTYGKPEVIERTKKAKWEKNELSDVKVTSYGSSAIATGVWTGKGTDGTGKAIDTKERWADTWVKMPNGKWQCVASASATLKQ